MQNAKTQWRKGEKPGIRITCPCGVSELLPIPTKRTPQQVAEAKGWHFVHVSPGPVLRGVCDECFEIDKNVWD